MASIAELEAALASARARVERASGIWARRHSEAERAEVFAAHDAMLEAERALAAGQGVPYAEPVDFPVRWSRGAPLPHLLASDSRCYLLFHVEEIDPDWDGTTCRVVGPGSQVEVAIVEFELCMAATLGMPNDEALHGHPLWGRGLAAYGAYRVRNSAWIAEQSAINAVHPHDSPALWSGLAHFILGFHDTTFECVAASFRVQTRRTTIVEALQEVCGRL